jgi:plasmid rolling circle replication initiator protein Rep
MQFDEIRELKTRKEDFVKILKDLIEWDEQIKTKSPKFLENLKIKKTLAEMPSKKLKITFLKLDEFIFYVVVQYKSLNGEITTSWVHEDENL